MLCMKDVNLKGNCSANRLAKNDYLKFLRKNWKVQNTALKKGTQIVCFASNVEYKVH